MDYIEHRFEISPLLPAREILLAELAELGFESFVEEDFGLLAYIPAVAGEPLETAPLKWPKCLSHCPYQVPMLRPTRGRAWCAS